MLLGAVVFFGWLIDSPVLERLHPSFVPMKANTALSFILLGGGLQTLGRSGRSAWRLRRAIAVVIMSVATATLLEFALSLDLGIDQAFVRDLGDQTRTPGRMSPATAVNFALFGLSLWCQRRDAPASVVAHVAVLAVTLISFVALTGYLFGAASLYRIGPYSSIAFHTVLGFLTACVAFQCAEPTRGFMAVVFSDTTAGTLLRRVLPAAVLVPIGLGWLRLVAERHGLSDVHFGLAVVTAGDVVLLTTVLSMVGSRLHTAEEEVRANASRLQLAIEASPTGMLIVDRSGKIVLVNAESERLFGYTRNELVGQTIEALIPTRFRRQHATSREAFFSAPDARPMAAGLELFAMRSDGSEVPVEVGLNPLAVRAELVLASVVDVTAKKRAAREHEELMEQRKATALLRERGRFFDLSIDMVCIANASGTFDQLNPAFSQVLGYTTEELRAKPFLDFVHPEDRPATVREWEKLQAGVLTLDFTNRYRRKDGEYRWLQWRAAPESDGTIYAIARDVTRDRELLSELQTKQASLGRSLKEREVLLQEVHHRVKNNLQIISSLVSLQARQLRDAFAQTALMECKERVEAIAAIHEELYRAEDFASVPFQKYAKRLAQNLFRASGSPSSTISLEMDIEDITLSVDRAIPCGLILNELITNALKHAFPEGMGKIRVSLRKADREIVLTVADDGAGMPAHFDPRTSSSLGMQLVTTLGEQLRGHIDIESGRGTTFRVSFPAEERA